MNSNNEGLVTIVVNSQGQVFGLHVDDQGEFILVGESGARTRMGKFNPSELAAEIVSSIEPDPSSHEAGILRVEIANVLAELED